MAWGDRGEIYTDKVGRKKRSGPVTGGTRRGDKGQGCGRRYGTAVANHDWTG